MAQAPPYVQGQGPDQLPEGGASELNNMPNVVSADAGAAQVAAGAQEAGSQSQPQQQQQASTPDTSGGDQAAAPVQHPLDQLPQQTPEAPVDFTPSTPEDQFLFAPGEGGVGGPQPGGSLTAGAIPPPPDVTDWLPSLQIAASDPNANPAVKALFQLVSYHLNQAG